MKKICKDCKKLKEHHGKGRCKDCYNHWYYINHRDEILEQKKQYDKWYKNRPELSLKKRIENGEWIEI